MIRYYLKVLNPEQMDDATWCDCLLDIWMYRWKEAKEVKKATS